MVDLGIMTTAHSSGGSCYEHSRGGYAVVVDFAMITAGVDLASTWCSHINCGGNQRCSIIITNNNYYACCNL